jgi:hypothetical protein
MRRYLVTIALVCAIGPCMIATPAVAASGAGAVADCNAHGTLTTHYSPAQLRNALDTMPADVKEYTNCYDVIQRALVGELGQSPTSGGRQSGSSSGDSLLPTPVIVVLALLVVAGAAFGIVALRRRGAVGGGDHP